MTGVQADRELDIRAARRFTQERTGTAVCTVCGAVTRSMISDMIDHFEAANRGSDEKAKSETGFRKFVANTRRAATMSNAQRWIITLVIGGLGGLISCVSDSSQPQPLYDYVRHVFNRDGAGCCRAATDPHERRRMKLGDLLLVGGAVFFLALFGSLAKLGRVL